MGRCIECCRYESLARPCYWNFATYIRRHTTSSVEHPISTCTVWQKSKFCPLLSTFTRSTSIKYALTSTPARGITFPVVIEQDRIYRPRMKCNNCWTNVLRFSWERSCIRLWFSEYFAATLPELFHKVPWCPESNKTEKMNWRSGRYINKM